MKQSIRIKFQSDRTTGLTALLFAVSCAILFFLAPSQVWAAERQVVPGHVPAAVTRLAPVDRLTNTNILRLAIGLPWRNREALTNLLQQVYDPTSPNYRQYLTTEQFTEQFGPTVQDYQTLVEFAKSKGLNVTVQHPNRAVLSVEGTVANIENAFQLTLRVYQHPKEARTFYAPDAEPSLDLGVPILHVSGLDTYSLPHPNYKLAPANLQPNVSPNAGSGAGGNYLGNDFRAAYVPGTTLTGAGQSIGLVQFDGYLASDITAYETLAGLPNVPLTNVLIDGATGAPSGNGGEVEVSLDIEMVISMAPGISRVYVYMAPNPSPWVDMLSRMANDNLSKQLSCSWGGGGPDATAEGIFQQMAAQGQSFFNATGDSDAFTTAIPFPSESPNITQVGATTLSTTGPGGSFVTEKVWNLDKLGAAGIGSSGGISTFFPIPIYQLGIDMAASKGSTTMRNVPDVALTGDNVLVIADTGRQLLGVGGTSVAAPLWAGFTALINQQAAAKARSPVGFLNPALYAIGKGANYSTAFHDTTTGDNTKSGSPSLFFAVPGFDLCTGLGSPNGMNLINALIPTNQLFTYYSNNFQNLVGSEWSSTNRDITPLGGRIFLGQFSNQVVTLTLTNLPAHTNLDVSFDLFIIRSWDGNGPANGPDIWDVSVAGVSNLLHTTFSVLDGASSFPIVPQAFPDAFPGGSHPARTGAAENNTLGYFYTNGTTSVAADSVYRLSFSFPHFSNSLVLNLSGIGLQAITNESWGLDNILVQGSAAAIGLVIRDVTVQEGDSGTTNAVFTVTLNPTNSQTVLVSYSTADGTARAGIDYVATSGTLAFAPGTSSMTITVPVRGDLIFETNETFFVNLFGAYGATIASSQGKGTILSEITDTQTIAISIGDAMVFEGNSGFTPATFDVVLSRASTNTVTVNYATANFTATAGSDYVATSGTLTFAPGVTNQTVSILVLGDTLNEADETFYVDLTFPTNADISKGRGVGTIQNDDPLPVINIDHVSVTEGDSGTTNAVFTVSLSVASGQPVIVAYATGIGTAVPGVDYLPASGSLVFSPGTTSKTITVKVIGDTVTEGNETFFVNLSDAVNGLIQRNQGVGTIVNDDPLPSLTISDTSVTEGDSGTTNAVFTVTLSKASELAASVNFTTQDGTATLLNNDYLTNSGTLNFPPGVTSQTITVLVSGDTVDEQNETFFVNLSSISGATLARAQATGTILNDDGPVLSINDVTVAEGNVGITDAILTVTLLHANANTVTVKFNTLNGTATLANSDYQTNSGSLTFPPGITSRTITNKVVGDTAAESTETFSVVLTNPSFATIARNQGMVTITDDDTLADVALTMTGSVAPIYVGGDLTYTITVTNRGPYGATNVVVTDTLPASVTFISATPSQGSCTNIAGVVTCNLGVLTNGASALITILVSPTAVGLITNSAVVMADEIDPNPANNSVSLTTTAITPLITILTAGAALTSESVQPPNGAIDPNETVTMTFALRNTGNKNTTNLMAALQVTGDVSSPSAAQNYGALVYGGPAISKSFTFLVSGPAGGTVQAVLQLMDGALDLGTVTNIFRIGSGGTFTDTAAIKIPDTGTKGPASQYPAQINVSGLTGIVSKVTLTLSNLTHAFAADLDILLVSPTGEAVIVMSDAGGVEGVSGITLTLDDAAASPLPDTGAIVSGTFRPADYSAGGPDIFPAPAPAAPYGTTLSAFNGINPNGDWSLYLVDDAIGEKGIIAGGWSLQIQTVTTISPTAGLSVIITNSPGTNYVGGSLTNTITVHNQGPDTANNVVVTDNLPGGVTFVSAISSQGTCTFTNGTVTCALGNLVSNGTAVVTVVITSLPEGTITSTAVVSGDEPDLNLANNLAIASATVKPFADLAITKTASPDPVILGNNLSYTVTVTNRGPSQASNVILTDTLATNVIFVSANSTQGICSQLNGIVTCNLGILTNGASVTVTIVVLPTTAGVVTGSAKVTAAEDDREPANNDTNLIPVTVNPSADLAVMQSSTPNPVTIWERLTYTITVTNRGSATATGVVVTNRLPTGVNIGLVTSSLGSCQTFNGVVTCNISTLPSGASATITIAVTNTIAGTATNVVSVVANETDLNLSNNTSTGTTSVSDLAADIVTAGASLTAESIIPANGAVDPAETVTLNLALRNKGALNTSSALTATLLATGGVSAPSGPQVYGVLGSGGSSVSRAFTFTANGAVGGVVTATLQLQDGAVNLGTVNYTFYLGALASFTNQNTIAIPEAGTVGKAAPYPSGIVVSGVTGTVSKVTVTLNGLSHTYPDDIDIVLVSPTGRSVVVMSDAGGGTSITNVTLTFDDAAANALPDATLISSGTYKPTNFNQQGAEDAFIDSPVPAGPYDSTLAAFNGTNPNGTWSLYIVDDSDGDSGVLARGWSLTVASVTTVNPSVDLAVKITAAPNPVVLGNNVTYIITLTNKGPNTATGIVVTDPLAPNLNFVSVSSSNFTAANVGGTVTSTLGSLEPGKTASLTIVAKPNRPGLITNIVSVVADQVELVSADNTVAALITVEGAWLASQSGGSLTNGHFGLTLNLIGAAGRVYVIEASTNLITWIPIQTNTVAGSTNYLDFNAATFPYRFYRALYP